MAESGWLQKFTICLQDHSKDVDEGEFQKWMASRYSGSLGGVSIEMLFRSIDLDEDNAITPAEFNKAMKGKRKGDLRELCHQLDLDWEKFWLMRHSGRSRWTSSLRCAAGSKRYRSRID